MADQPQGHPAAGVAGPLPNVKHVIAVGAGKGGVGKSTLSVLLAVGLRRLGNKIGVLDADVYGPSLPKLTGTEDAQPEIDERGMVIPPTFGDIRVMSMGHIVPADQAVIWRGPMAQKYVKEFLERGDWGELDYLIVDLPPGTGDIPLTLAQSIPLTGAVVVCTPQDVALLDAVKAHRMYEKLGVPALGFVENMSYYLLPDGQRDYLFGEGGVERTAVDLGVPFLGGIPISRKLRELGDAGKPAETLTETEPHVIEAIQVVVRRLGEEVAARASRDAASPTLTIED